MSPVFEKYAIDNIISLQRLRQQKQSHLDAIYNCKKHCVAVILFRFFADPVLSCSFSWATYFRRPLDRVRYDSLSFKIFVKKTILFYCLFDLGFRPGQIRFYSTSQKNDITIQFRFTPSSDVNDKNAHLKTMNLINFFN